MHLNASLFIVRVFRCRFTNKPNKIRIIIFAETYQVFPRRRRKSIRTFETGGLFVLRQTTVSLGDVPLVQAARNSISSHLVSSLLRIFFTDSLPSRRFLPFCFPGNNVREATPIRQGFTTFSRIFFVGWLLVDFSFRRCEILEFLFSFMSL